MRPAARTGLLVAAAALAADQATKIAAVSLLAPGESVRVLGDLLVLGLRWNRGAAFSLSWGGPWVLAALSAAASAAVLVLLLRWRGAGRLESWCLGLILGGAAGNLLDRLARGGAVADFIDAGIGGARWPTFNLADAAITVGALLMTFFHRSGRSGDA